ncbi:DEAD/DEAH box helicase [Tardiphaga sp. OK245]|jgi:superfamily II DNA/RNA helicase|uniref:DEAD/DEAH box helicase n=1 Tax=Tardiphaga sp. OK245 TaxID=1855306 RepID=UPI0008A80C07|nr:DEAD/DEAH box helicase [Tardiphaga sp. OK245]SEI00046.1 Superfamily II DNA and RNA helicase [Tardiphaga sp. OK245]
MSFSNLGLSDKVLAAVAATGYTTPTPIQEQAIPHVLARKDVLGIAQTGTGKTAAFVLPMMTMLEKGRARARMPRTLILEPTRELAAQVKEQFDKYGVGQKLNVALLIGGVSFGDQDSKLTRGVDVLIATPGRLLDHTERGGLLLTGVELLVIDEADRMLDMGFIPDIERICKLVPFTRQTLFFTATMPAEIRRVTETFLHNPVKIEVSKPASTAVTVTQSQVAVGREPHEKREVLRALLREATDLKNAIIFCNRKREVALLAKSLQKHGFSVGALHGDMEQSARTAALDQFRKGELPILVASDVAARGLDIPAVSHVYNFDVPHHSDDYVHRIGRTGRAGRTGSAISLVCPSDQKSMLAIEKLIGQSIPKVETSIAISEPVEGETAEASRQSRNRTSNREANAEHPRSSRNDQPREGGRDRKPRRERGPRREGGRSEGGERSPQAQPAEAALAAPVVAAAAPQAQRPPSIGRAEAPRSRREDNEPADHSHLPAFLLRPIRARA